MIVMVADERREAQRPERFTGRSGGSAGSEDGRRAGSALWPSSAHRGSKWPQTTQHLQLSGQLLFSPDRNNGKMTASHMPANT